MDIQKDIEGWLKSLKGWQTELGYQLLSKSTLSSDDISLIIEMLKGDKPFEDKEFPKIGQTESKHIILKYIGNISNIEKLAPKNPLKFAQTGLTIIYGDNGTGKSGYTRILKKVCGKPNAKELTGNIYSKDVTIGQCNICYTVEAEDKTHTWKINEAAIPDLKIIDIFDTDTGIAYLRDSNTATYTPPIIAFFQRFTEAHDNIKNILLSEKDKLTSKLPQPSANLVKSQFILHYQSANIDVAKFSWKEEDEKKRIALEEKLKEVDPKSTANKIREQKAKLEAIIKDLQAAADKVSCQAYDTIVELHHDSTTKSTAVIEASKVLDESVKLQGVGSATWKSLWSAAKDYALSEAYKDDKALEDHDRCVLCHQILDADAKKRLKVFECFILDKISKEAEAAERICNEALQKLPTNIIAEDIDNKCIAAGLDENWRKQICNIWDKICKNGELISKYNKPQNYTDEINTAVSALKAMVQQYGKKITDLELIDKGFDRAASQRVLLEFNTQKWCSEQIEAIRVEKDRQNKIQKITAWANQTNTHKITSKATEISNNIVTEEYVKRFNNELNKLGAEIKVIIKKQSTKGVIKHSLVLESAERSPIEVLSEGEMRIIALAAFIADVTGGNENNPFIFDDPISSLDQRYEENTVKRLIELSKTRQLIVFTHRLSLLSQLYDGDKTATLIGIRSEYWGTGETGNTPIFTQKPIPALNDIKNSALTRAKKTLETEGSEAYYPLWKAICSDIRIIIERIVESTLLADVVVRYRRPINTLGKVKELAKINQDDCIMVDRFMSRYSVFEHSQPGEAPVKPPLPDEIGADLETLLQWLDEFTKRK